MSKKLLPALITFLSVLAAIYVTFLHPPLVLTAGPGDYADARAHCLQVKKDYISKNTDWLGNSKDATGEFDDLFVDEQYKRCMSNASVRLPELAVQLVVIILSSAALLWATRFLK